MTPASGSAKQDRRAVGGEDAEGEAGDVGDHGVAFGPVVELDWAATERGRGRVHLIEGHEASAGKCSGVSAASAVCCNVCGIVAARLGHVERGEDAGRDAAAAAEEAVVDAGQAGQCIAVFEGDGHDEKPIG